MANYRLPPKIAASLDRIRLDEWEDSDLRTIVEPYYVLTLAMDRLAWLYDTLENYDKRTRRRYISPEDRKEFLGIAEFVRRAFNETDS